MTALFMADEHFDNAHCDRGLLREHHEEAKIRGAMIFKVGDTFCAMQGKWDKRADERELRPEHRGGNYLDRLVDTAAEFYSPFAANIGFISPGNHESSITQRHQTNLTERLVALLRREGSPVTLGDYWSFVRFSIFTNGHSHKTVAVDTHLHHGYGGGGEVTRGMIDNSRTRSQYMANIYVSGHVHRRNYDENVMTTVTQKGRVRQIVQYFLRCGSYKNETNGWHAAQGGAGRPMGGWWVTMELDRDRTGGDDVCMPRIKIEAA